MYPTESRFPDTLPQKSAQWATLCFDRSPEFKVHTSKGLAHSAIANKKPDTEIALYENQAGTWTKVWEYVTPLICRCGKTYDEGCTDRYRRNKLNIDPDFAGSVKDAPVICGDCYSNIVLSRYEAKKEADERKKLAELQAKYDRPTARIGGLENLIAKD